MVGAKEHFRGKRRSRGKGADTRSKEYRAYLAEFTLLREAGIRLYCPEEREITPAGLAGRMAGDRRATYMRDCVFDPEEGVMRVCFQRVEIF